MKPTQQPTLISIVGPTAVGKTAMAIDLAQEFNTEIISADSRQFYKELSIGTAKPSLEKLEAATHHFVNNLSILEAYNASDFEQEVLNFLTGFFKSNPIAIMCGGSGMYVDAVLKGFDQGVPTSNQAIRKKLNQQLEVDGLESLQAQLKQLDSKLYEKIDLKNSKRLLRALEVCLITGKPFSDLRKKVLKKRPFNIIKVGLQEDREKLYDKINQRVDLMMQAGLLNEVKSVAQFRYQNALKTVGYKELFNYLDGDISLEKAIEKIKVNSRRYAKRQLTWFKRDNEIEWFEVTQKAQIIEYIRSRINSNGQ